MQKSNRRKVIHMQICITLAKNYRKTRHGETGTKITYDIRELKTHPEKLQNHMELKKEHYEYKTNLTTQQKWRNVEKEIHSSLTEIYPRRNKTQLEKDNDWISKQKNWCTPQEQQTME